MLGANPNLESGLTTEDAQNERTNPLNTNGRKSASGRIRLPEKGQQ
jgi:hypothetical protein